MNLTVLFACVSMLVLGSNASLECYQCTGKEADCPKIPTVAELEKMHKVTCNTYLSTVCAKYSVDLLGGESFTTRDCAPTYIGGSAAAQIDFCTFINSLYTPLVSAGLIAKSSCNSCETIHCNT